MSRRAIPRPISMVMVIVAFIVAAIPTFGLVLKEDPIGRIIFAVVWVLIGIGWLEHLIRVKKSASKR